MAILSKEVILEDDTWTLISARGFIGQKGNGDVIYIVNADAVPADMHVPEAMTYGDTDKLYFLAPAAGSFYAKSRTGTTTLAFYEV